MVICVIATASSVGGALTIYKQFLSSLELYKGQDEWHVFIDKEMPMPEINGVYYHVCYTKGLQRILFDVYGFRKIIKTKRIAPQVIFSLQNTGVRYKSKRSVIYFHQPLPFYQYKCQLFDSFKKTYLFYHYWYPLYVRLFLNDSTYIATQTRIMKENFIKRFSFLPERVGVYFPRIEEFNPNEIVAYSFEEGTFNFVYPASSVAYKEHITIAYAIKALYNVNPMVAKQIRIHLTVKKGDISCLGVFLRESNMEENFVFYEGIPHNQVMTMLKGCNALLFPSVIETLGLPLLEAASLGTPVIANDMGYVHEVLKGYEGVRYVPVHDYEEWARNMIACCEKRDRYAPYRNKESDSWERLFKLITEGEICN